MLVVNIFHAIALFAVLPTLTNESSVGGKSSMINEPIRQRDKNIVGGALNKLLSNLQNSDALKYGSNEMKDNYKVETSTTDGALTLTLPKEEADPEIKPNTVSDPNAEKNKNTPSDTAPASRSTYDIEVSDSKSETTQNTHKPSTAKSTKKTEEYDYKAEKTQTTHRSPAIRSTKDVEDIIGAPNAVLNRIWQNRKLQPQLQPYADPEDGSDGSSSSSDDEDHDEDDDSLPVLPPGTGGQQETGRTRDRETDDAGGTVDEGEVDDDGDDDMDDTERPSIPNPTMIPNPSCAAPSQYANYPPISMTQCATMNYRTKPCTCTKPPPCIMFQFPENQRFDFPIPKLSPVVLGSNPLSHVVGVRSIPSSSVTSCMPSCIALTLHASIVTILTVIIR